MSLPRFDYRAPRTVGEAIALRQEFGDDALLMAGGLATVILLRERMISPRVVVSLSAIPEAAPRRDQQRASIGAMVTHGEVARSAAIRKLRAAVPKPAGASAHRRSATWGRWAATSATATPPQIQLRHC